MAKEIEYEDEEDSLENLEDSDKLDFDDVGAEAKEKVMPATRPRGRPPANQANQANQTKAGQAPQEPQVIEVPRVVSSEQMLNLIYERQEMILALLQALLKPEEAKQ